MQRFGSVAAVFAFALALAGQASAGKIVLANDEWTLSDIGFGVGGTNSAEFVENVTAWFGAPTGGTFHAFSTNFGLTEASLAAVMIANGHTYTTGFGPTFDLPTLLSFDGIFLAGPGPGIDTSVLIDYVNAGGNVYLAGGTGRFTGGAPAEAAFWNPFLNAFGLGFGSPYNGRQGALPISSTHPIFDGPGGVVTRLYQNNGNDALDIDVTDPRGQVLVSLNGHALYAVFDSELQRAPEPSTLFLLGAGLLGLLVAKRKSS